MTTIAELITPCRLELIDSGTPTRWADAEFLGYYNQFLQEVVTIAPATVATARVLNFVAGAKQTLPPDVSRLIEIVRNAGGRSCSRFDREKLTLFDPDWANAEAASSVYQYWYDPHVASVVYVSPPLALGSSVEALVVPILPAAPTVGTVSDLPLHVLPAAINYMLYRACQKDAEDTFMGNKATQYYSRMLQLLGGKGE